MKYVELFPAFVSYGMPKSPLREYLLMMNLTLFFVFSAEGLVHTVLHYVCEFADDRRVVREPVKVVQPTDFRVEFSDNLNIRFIY